MNPLCTLHTCTLTPQIKACPSQTRRCRLSTASRYPSRPPTLQMLTSSGAPTRSITDGHLHARAISYNRIMQWRWLLLPLQQPLLATDQLLQQRSPTSWWRRLWPAPVRRDCERNEALPAFPRALQRRPVTSCVSCEYVEMWVSVPLPAPCSITAGWCSGVLTLQDPFLGTHQAHRQRWAAAACPCLRMAACGGRALGAGCGLPA